MPGEALENRGKKVRRQIAFLRNMIQHVAAGVAGNEYGRSDGVLAGR